MRTFIELELPPQSKEYIQRQQDGLRSVMTVQGVDRCFRWTPVANIHLTLRFLGETSSQQQQSLISGLTAIAAEWTKIRLRIGNMGCFPNTRRPRVLWLGLDGELNALNRLQQAVEQLVQEIGFEPELRPYAPHLTIARTKRNCTQDDLQKAGEILSQQAPTSQPIGGNGDFSACRLVHMRSDLRSSGSVYTPLSTHELAG